MKNSNKYRSWSTRKCTICNEVYSGWGNNAIPVNAGRCCDNCNTIVVIPARIKQLRERNEE